LESLTPFFNILKVALGLGFVIFLHELGHFLLAKWNGVKVEKFSIGFGPTLLGFRRGETEYVLAAIPLGGYVKMLGENPEDAESKTTDPRAYPNKSVGARMAIISAGVIMNVILGLICFVYAYGRGIDQKPAIIGMVLPGSPAYEAGLRAGDEIVAIDGRRDVTYSTMMLKVSLSKAGQKLRFDVDRPGHEKPVTIEIEPKREEDEDVPRIGVLSVEGMEVADTKYRQAVGRTTKTTLKELGLEPGDVLVSMGPEGTEPAKIKDANELHQIFATHRAVPLVLVFERPAKTGEKSAAGPKEIKVVVPPNPVVDLGFESVMGPIASIQANSIAEKAGFQVGDLVTKVDGNTDLNPLRLAEYCFDRAGKPVTFEVERKGKDKGTDMVQIEVIPDNSFYTLDFYAPGPVGIPGLGLAYQLKPKVSRLEGGSKAESVLKVGDEITSIQLFPKNAELAARSEAIKLVPGSSEWPTLLSEIQSVPVNKVELVVGKAAKPIELTPSPREEWYNPWRGLSFLPLVRKLPPQTVQAALKRGLDDTIDNILQMYATLRSLFQNRISPKVLGGPIMIANVAYSQADTGLTQLVHFLGILSINLAVLNFLPIPPLDGGQMVFLIAEKVRGKPLPDSAMIAGSWLGIVMLLGLMMYVMYQDIYRFFLQ